ncbi:glycoside hydrolase family 38 C-terminal domain-containing protein [Paenibacillus sp. MMS20-IR301]|uniref:glycoside hydrolase family 38 N-terminal domain-containing protein n=1 Tax=Paenibacillus sp. MMS20-IR301 TaxID=2895946 RepID=UPI0028EAAEF1|nr:glycoside hydrolase family 38 C-terminal domain-containing protein [Paenibacillus sp. MMS20-IR301]WNS43157.1 glycoside hydrolase family 38 C-terminal domain-containing protein [Paenibacillus sp. MMS20-IR301]
MKRKLHLLSNAHLDPVWQWEWEEGAAAAVSTFRAAAEFCEENDEYIFNHNEVILYQWVEEYEPALFKRIQRLVKEGKWHIMGGWYLQPDCNMISGESFVRQILLGKAYFRAKFGAEPATAINFDSFGHSRGLVQILVQAGYDSYIFMRPDEMEGLPADDFSWEGYNGSKVMAHKIEGGYNSLMGKTRGKIERWLGDHPQQQTGLVLWGVGNHGGGPSRTDLAQIAELMQERDDVEIVHSTPERYFAELKQKGAELPVYAGDLNPRFVGCYTSMIRIKQQHRLLENELFLTEKMLSAAALQGLLPYPAAGLQEALRDLLTAQFHDILPGTSVQNAEEASLRQLGHGLETAARLKTRAFFALAAGQPKAALKEYPVLIYNPHPYAVTGVFECEFMLEDQNWSEEYSLPVVYQGGRRLPCQPEKERSNIPLDWRKRVAFTAELAPSSMNRFDCRMEMLPDKPLPQLAGQDGCFRFETAELTVIINARTGLMDEYTAGGHSLLRPGAFAPLVMADNEDPWRMDTDRFDQVEGVFTLMGEAESARFSGVKQPLPAVRVIEDGEVRTVIETVLSYGSSSITQTYKLPKQGTEVEIELRVYWNEKDKLLKLAVPTVLAQAGYFGQTAFGVQQLDRNGRESAAQKWVSAEDAAQNLALTCINSGIYGSDFRQGELRLSLLRSAGYCAHPIGDRPIMAQDRFLPRMDQGERSYTFWLNGGTREERRRLVDREALVHNERPYALSFFPSGEGEQPGPCVLLADDSIQLSAFKREEYGDGFILRLFEPTGLGGATVVSLPALGIRREVSLNGYEIKTFRLLPASRTLEEAPLCEV